MAKGKVIVSAILGKGGKKTFHFQDIITSDDVNNWDALIISKHIVVIEEDTEELQEAIKDVSEIEKLVYRFPIDGDEEAIKEEYSTEELRDLIEYYKGEYNKSDNKTELVEKLVKVKS